ncbi:MAG: hypothetical protein JW893_03945 [Candidatus Omnitrophica bacterium]|nr:hypothetical protein [Candidatus Omnitrophota bacterium]
MMKKASKNKLLTLFKKGIALCLSLILLGFNLPSVTFASAASQIQKPTGVFPGIVIPSNLGRVDEVYQGPSGKGIIYIQDAHDSLEAQENIAAIIRELVSKNQVQTVFEEGYEGQVPTDDYFGFIQDPAVREKVSYFFLDKLRIGGAEYAHINREKNFKLIGVDDLKLHRENTKIYQEASAFQKDVDKVLEIFERDIQNIIHKRFPKNFRNWMKTREKYQSKSIDLLRYLEETRKLYLESEKEDELKHNYPAIQWILEIQDGNARKVDEKIKTLDVRQLFRQIRALEEKLPELFLKEEKLRKAFSYYRELWLLKRLNHFQMTQSEFEVMQDVLERIDTEALADFIVAETKQSIAIPRQWEKHIAHAIRFYEVATERNRAVETHFDQFLSNREESLAALVFGGFHQADLKAVLKAKGISYIVVSPKMTEVSKMHRKYYKQLMSQGHHDFESGILGTASRPQPVFAIPGGRSEVHAVYEAVMASLDSPQPILHEQVMRWLKSRRSELRGNRADALRQFIASDVRQAMLDIKEAYGVSGLRVDQKPNKTIVTVTDHLVQVMTAVALSLYYPEDSFLGEERSDVKFLKSEFLRLAEEGSGFIYQKYQKYIDAYEQLQTPPLDEKKRPSVWRIVDPLDGTSGYARGELMYGYSLARTVWNNQAKGYRSESGFILAPEYETTYQGQTIRGPMLEYDGQNVKLWQTRNDGALELVEENVQMRTQTTSRALVLRDSKSVGPNPYLGPLFRAYSGNYDVEMKWNASTVGFMDAILGNIAVFGGMMQIWDHAAALGMIHALGGAVFRLDQSGYGRELVAYTPEDIERSKKDEKFPVIVAFGKRNIDHVRQLFENVQAFYYGAEQEIIVTIAKDGEITVWDGETKEIIDMEESFFPVETLEGIRMSASGRFLYQISKVKVRGDSDSPKTGKSLAAEQEVINVWDLLNGGSYHFYNRMNATEWTEKVIRDLNALSVEQSADILMYRDLNGPYDAIMSDNAEPVDASLLAQTAAQEFRAKRQQFQRLEPDLSETAVVANPGEGAYQGVRIPAQPGDIFMLIAHPSDGVATYHQEHKFHFLKVEEPMVFSWRKPRGVVTHLEKVWGTEMNYGFSGSNIEMAGFNNQNQLRYERHDKKGVLSEPGKIYVPGVVDIRHVDWREAREDAERHDLEGEPEPLLVFHKSDGTVMRMRAVWDPEAKELRFEDVGEEIRMYQEKEMDMPFAVMKLRQTSFEETRQDIGYQFPFTLTRQVFIRPGGTIEYLEKGVRIRHIIDEVEYDMEFNDLPYRINHHRKPVKLRFRGQTKWINVEKFNNLRLQAKYFSPIAMPKQELVRSELRQGNEQEALSEEFLVMTTEFKNIVMGRKAQSREGLPIFLRIREYTKGKLANRFDEDRADETILKIKEDVIPALLREWLGVEGQPHRARLRSLLQEQAEYYFGKVDGFGPVRYDVETDTEETLGPREDEHEDWFFASAQAVDCLSLITSAESIQMLIRLSRKGLEAHQRSVKLQEKLDEVDRARKDNDEEVLKRLSVETSSLQEAVSRWTRFEAMIIKVLSDMTQEIEGSLDQKDPYQAINRLLIDILLDYQSSGEGFYWLRQQAAYRLKNFETQETMTSLEIVLDPSRPERQVPSDSVYVTMNLESANKDTVSILLSAGMSLMHVHQKRAYKNIFTDAEVYAASPDFEKKEYRVARLIGVLLALVDPGLGEESRLIMLKRIAGIQSDDFALAANIMLDVLEDFVMKMTGDTILEEHGRIISDRVREEALSAYKRIAVAVGKELEASGNVPLMEEYQQDLLQLTVANFEAFAWKVHVILGNMHRLAALKNFPEGQDCLRLKHRVVIESGGGAALAMGGVVDRMTSEPAAAEISGTDNGGSGGLARGDNVSRRRIRTAAGGDIQTFDSRSAVTEGVPGSKVIEKLMQQRFGQNMGPFANELQQLYANAHKTAVQDGTEQQFERIFQQMLQYAGVVDAMGMSADLHAVKGLIYEGVLNLTRGHGEDFMNPDGIYAGLIEYAHLLGARGMGVLDDPFGNEMIVYGRDGQEYIGQAYFSHTPKGTLYGRERKVYRMWDISTYYDNVPHHSRVEELLESAELIVSGLTSWGTSLGILQKNKKVVDAKKRNKHGVKMLVTNAVRDDETRGMSWWESTVTFLEGMIGGPLEEVWNTILSDSNEGIGDLLILPARPHLGTHLDAYNGKHGAYAGPNTPTPEEVERIRERGIAIDASHHMMDVILKPQRQNPDLYHAMVSAVPELLASAMWDLIDPVVQQRLTPKPVFSLIQRYEELDALLHDVGLSWESFGMESVHELIFRQDLTKELAAWLDEPHHIPVWVAGKTNSETWFQYTVARAVRSILKERIPVMEIAVDRPVQIGEFHHIPLYLTYSSRNQTKELFIGSRLAIVGDEEKLQEEEMHRLGIIQRQEDGIHIILPFEIMDVGWTPARRIKNMETVLRFQMEKLARLYDARFQNEWEVHRSLMANIQKLVADGSESKGKDMDRRYVRRLGGLSFGVPLLRFLLDATDERQHPVLFYDMDGTVTPSGVAKSQDMAYSALIFSRVDLILDYVISGQAFEGPWRQIIEPLKEAERILHWVSVRTGIPRESHVLGQVEGIEKSLSQLVIGAASGNAVYAYLLDGTGYEKIYQNSMDKLKGRLIELAARITMPETWYWEEDQKSWYDVSGHQIEYREPDVVMKGVDGKQVAETRGNAAIAVLPSGRHDLKRKFDPPPQAVKRRKQGMLMDLILRNPTPVLKQIQGFISTQKPPEEWRVQVVTEGGGTIELQVPYRTFIVDRTTGFEVAVDKSQISPDEFDQKYKEIKIDQVTPILALMERIPMTQMDPIKIAGQPGGQTTNDISPEPKSVGIARGINLLEKTILKMPREQMAAGFIGDEGYRMLVEANGQSFWSEGNDFSVAQEAGPLLKFISHVGPVGEGIEIPPNTVTSYDHRGIPPVATNRIRAAAGFSLRKGSALNVLKRYRKKIEVALAGRGLSFASFGVRDFDTEMNERRAQEVLAVAIRAELREQAEGPLRSELREFAAEVEETLGWSDVSVKEAEVLETTGSQQRRAVNIDQIISRINQDSVVMIDYDELVHQMTADQFNEFFALAFQYPAQLKLVIYHADLTDARLNPFRQADLLKNVKIVQGPAQGAYNEMLSWGVGMDEKPVIHISKGDAENRQSLDEVATSEIHFFRYNERETRSGLLTASLLYASLLGSDISAERLKEGLNWLGITRDKDGYLTVTSEFLDYLNRQYLAQLVIKIAA